MKRGLRNSLARDVAGAARVIASLLLCCALTGCESFQRKFVRQPKSQRPVSPIISFQDYSGAMTPLERYRKHYLMFEYWNSDVIEALQTGSPNPKRYRQSAEESLSELQTLQSLLSEEIAVKVAPLIEERVKINRRLRSPSLNVSQASSAAQSLEWQARRMHREFFWRDVQEHLKTTGTAPASSQAGDAAAH